MVEEWAEFDLLGAMRQMGAIPEPQQKRPGASHLPGRTRSPSEPPRRP
jgi:hypothetical protein